MLPPLLCPFQVALVSPSSCMNTYVLLLQWGHYQPGNSDGNGRSMDTIGVNRNMYVIFDIWYFTILLFKIFCCCYASFSVCFMYVYIYVHSPHTTQITPPLPSLLQVALMSLGSCMNTYVLLCTGVIIYLATVTLMEPHRLNNDKYENECMTIFLYFIFIFWLWIICLIVFIF